MGVLAIIGVETIGNQKLYRLLDMDISKTGDGQYNWKFRALRETEESIVNALKSNQSINATVNRQGKLVGKYASLDRFKGNNNPLVVLSVIKSQDERVVGYKVCSFNGSVKNIPIKELLAHCRRVTKQGGIPLQNAIYVAETGERDEHIKSYPNQKLITEIMHSKKNKNARERKVDNRKYDESLKESKIHDIYSKEQIRELRLGKTSGVDIKIFANPALSWKQMEVIREALERKIKNIRLIAFPEFDVQCMKFYVAELAGGVDIRNFLNPKYDLWQLGELSLAYELGLDLNKVGDVNTKVQDMTENRMRLQNNFWSELVVEKDGEW